jgi:TraM recognition site of TraD and TraG
MIIPDADRPMHIYVPGKTRHGKSTLLFWMALQDIARGRGVCVMDAKGDLVRMLLHYVPEYRVDDTIYLDIATPVPLDFMHYEGEREKEAVIGELKYTLTKTVETAHIPNISSNLENILYTLFEYNEHPDTPDHCRATFLDIHEFLENPERRKIILSRVEDEGLQRNWNKERFPNPTDRSRITTRMNPFVRSNTLRKIFGAKKPKLNIAECMDTKKVLLVNLGPMDETQRIYGTLLLSKIRQAAYRRTDPKRLRTPFHFYADEFQHFQTSDFDQMLSMAGGLGLYLTLANQHAEQLDSHILASIIGNVSTFIIFRTAHNTAQQFVQEIPSMKTEKVWRRDPRTSQMAWADRPIPFDPSDLSRLPVGHALYRAADGTASFIHTLGPPEPMDADYAEIIRKRTIEHYACEAGPSCSITVSSGSIASKPDNITAGEASHVPHHGGKKKKH